MELANDRAEERPFAPRLTDDSRKTILEIREQCWRDPQYRRGYSSMMDIFRAVLEDGVDSMDAFTRWLITRKGIKTSGT